MFVKEKDVELIELFYDLLFVFAISQLTSLINVPVNGFIPFTNFFEYLISSFVILQAWLYFTNYVNRYCEWKWYDYLIVCVNMIAVIYMSNMISLDWRPMYLGFDISMLVILLTIALLYLIHIKMEPENSGAAINTNKNIVIICFIYVIGIICCLLELWDYVVWINVAAILTGAFLPFFIKGDFDESIISFPHLVERFELLTIITFGEAIVGLTHFFKTDSISFIPIAVFFIILAMFGSYVVQIHYLVEHKRVERSLRLMFSHYFIIISINLVTVAFELIHNGSVNHFWANILMVSSLAVFYLCIMSNRTYYKENLSVSIKDIFLMVLLLLIGFSVMCVFIQDFNAFLIGNLIITVGIFSILLNKYNKNKIIESS